MEICTKCSEQFILEWVTFGNGTRHIKATCPKCGGKKHVPQSMSNRQVADEGQSVASIAEDNRIDRLSCFVYQMLKAKSSCGDVETMVDTIESAKFADEPMFDYARTVANRILNK